MPFTVLEFPEDGAGKSPDPPDNMLMEQSDGQTLTAAEALKSTWAWLTACGCAEFVSRELVERYAMSLARWVQCENHISEEGLLGSHPTTGAPVQSPYVAMSQAYLKQVNQLWYQITQVVREHGAADFDSSAVKNNMMEKLLASK